MNIFFKLSILFFCCFSFIVDAQEETYIVEKIPIDLGDEFPNVSFNDQGHLFGYITKDMPFVLLATSPNLASYIGGFKTILQHSHPYFWSPEYGKIPLTDPSGKNITGSAIGINNNDQVVGNTVHSNKVVPYTWNPEQGLQILDPYDDSSFTLAKSMNNHGQIAGISVLPEGNKYKVVYFLWDPKSGYTNFREEHTDFGDPYLRREKNFDWLDSEALLLNDQSQVAFIKSPPYGDKNIVYFLDKGKLNSYELPEEGNLLDVFHMDNKGEIFARLSGDTYFLWNKDQGVRHIHSNQSPSLIEEQNNFYLVERNNQNLILGTVENEEGNDFLIGWAEEKGIFVIQALPSSSWAYWVEDVNDLGQILISGYDDEGKTELFLFTP